MIFNKEYYLLLEYANLDLYKISMSKIKSFENEYLTFHFIEKRLSQKDYISHLKQMNCIICPMKHKFHVGPFVEFYGQTKINYLKFHNHIPLKLH